MPVRYEVEDETGIVVSTGALEPITFDEWRAHIDHLLGDPARKQPLRLIVDQRTRESVPSAGQLRRAVAYVSAELRPGSRDRVAFVVSQEVFYGMGRMAEIFAEIAGGFIEVRVFYDIEEAREWLLDE